MTIITKNVLTVEELKTLANQGNKAAVVYDVSTGEPFGLDLEVLIGMNSSIAGLQLNKMDLTGLNSNASVVNFNTSTPVVDVSIGALRWNSELGNLQYRISEDSYIDIGEELQYRGKNAESNTLVNGEVVYVYGSTGENLTIKRATNTDATIARKTFGVITESSITANAVGRFCIMGSVRGLNTASYAPGTILYLGVNGGWTGVKPTAPTPAIQIGIVLRQHGTDGIIYFNTRRIDRIEDLSDVYLPEKNNGDVLSWNSSTGRFEGMSIFDKALYLTYSNPTGLTDLTHDATAPTPTVDTKYIFTTSGDCTWISAGTMNVIKGDEVTCLVDAGVRTYIFLPNPSRSKDYYGVEWNMGAASSTLTRIGNMEWHRTLPVHSMMRRCILNDLGEVVYYLSATDSTKKEDGTDAILDGADGQVMVEIPRFYVALEHVADIARIKISLAPFPNSMMIEKMYISAYEAALNRTTSKLSSVLNTTTDYRGGNNTSVWDLESRTLLGKPATSINLTNFRTYARNRGAKWNCNVYLAQKVLWWLLRVEFSNTNDQLAFNSALTSEGYKQGGLGEGITTIDGANWNTFNAYNPLVPCGHTNSLGNATGYVNYTMPAEYDAVAKIIQVPSYRGIENPFGHIWKWTDGVKVKIQSDADGGLSELYVCLNPLNYQDTNYTNYIKRGILPRASGWGGKAIFGSFGEMLPVNIIGGSTIYLCDYFYTSIPVSGTEQRGLLFGGNADGGATAGCAYASSAYSPAFTYASVGSRLCFLNI